MHSAVQNTLKEYSDIWRQRRHRDKSSQPNIIYGRWNLYSDEYDDGLNTTKYQQPAHADHVLKVYF